MPPTALLAQHRLCRDPAVACAICMCTQEASCQGPCHYHYELGMPTSYTADFLAVALTLIRFMFIRRYKVRYINHGNGQGVSS